MLSELLEEYRHMRHGTNGHRNGHDVHHGDTGGGDDDDYGEEGDWCLSRTFVRRCSEAFLNLGMQPQGGQQAQGQQAGADAQPQEQGGCNKCRRRSCVLNVTQWKFTVTLRLIYNEKVCGFISQPVPQAT